MAVRQDGMVQGTWREDFALDETKVEADVGVTRLGNEFRMTFGVHTGFVDPRVQGGDINVMDLLAGSDMVVQLDSIGTTSTESVTRVEGVVEVQVVDEGLDLWVRFFETFPFAPPYLDHSVPLFSKLLDLVLRGFVDILHGSIIVTHMFFVAVWIAGGTSMGETTLKFVHGLGVVAVTIHEPHGWDANLTGIARVLNVLGLLLGTPG